MPQSVITVAGITPPGVGKKQGKIHDTIGNNWNVWGDKIQNYRMGVTYNITYEENEFNGKMFNLIKSADPSNAQPAQPQRQAPQPAPAAFTPTPTAKDEMIFVCGLINNSVSNANINPFELTATELIALVNKARQVWRNTLGKAQAADDMDDQVPFP